jgi:hypothetical protein
MEKSEIIEMNRRFMFYEIGTLTVLDSKFFLVVYDSFLKKPSYHEIKEGFIDSLLIIFNEITNGKQREALISKLTEGKTVLHANRIVESSIQGEFSQRAVIEIGDFNFTFQIVKYKAVSNTSTLLFELRELENISSKVKLDIIANLIISSKENKSV